MTRCSICGIEGYNKFSCPRHAGKLKSKRKPRQKKSSVGSAARSAIIIAVEATGAAAVVVAVGVVCAACGVVATSDHQTTGDTIVLTESYIQPSSLSLHNLLPPQPYTTTKGKPRLIVLEPRGAVVRAKSNPIKRSQMKLPRINLGN